MISFFCLVHCLFSLSLFSVVLYLWFCPSSTNLSSLISFSRQNDVCSYVCVIQVASQTTLLIHKLFVFIFSWQSFHIPSHLTSLLKVKFRLSHFISEEPLCILPKDVVKYGRASTLNQFLWFQVQLSSLCCLAQPRRREQCLSWGIPSFLCDAVLTVIIHFGYCYHHGKFRLSR